MQKTSNKSADPSNHPAPASVSSSEVREIFDGIAADYDQFNSWASLGLDKYWRRALVERIPANARLLDIATGTGDVAFCAVDRCREVVGLDSSQAMLDIARKKDVPPSILWISASADRIPFRDNSFGCVTSAFALRNFKNSLDAVLRENFRVLASKGRVLHMDFGRPSGLMGWGHRIYMSTVVPFMGRRICGARWPEGYLEATIAHFYEPSQMVGMLEKAGFERVTRRSLLGGVVQIYEGTKP